MSTFDTFLSFLYTKLNGASSEFGKPHHTILVVFTKLHFSVIPPHIIFLFLHPIILSHFILMLLGRYFQYLNCYPLMFNKNVEVLPFGKCSSNKFVCYQMLFLFFTIKLFFLLGYLGNFSYFLMWVSFSRPHVSYFPLNLIRKY